MKLKQLKPERNKSGVTQPERRRGAATVEFAVVAPVMFLILIGIIECGRAFMVAPLMTNAAREGARMAVIDGSTNQVVIQTVEQFLVDSAGVDAEDVTVTIILDNAEAGGQVSNAVSGDACTVKVEIPFSAVQYIAATFLQDAIMRSEITMRHE